MKNRVSKGDPSGHGGRYTKDMSGKNKIPKAKQALPPANVKYDLDVDDPSLNEAYRAWVESQKTQENETITVTTKACIFCRKTGEVDVPKKQYNDYKKGKSARLAFVGMEPGLREQLVSGTHPECFSSGLGNWNRRQAED